MKRVIRSITGRPNKVYSYQSYIDFSLKSMDVSKKIYPCIVPNFDHTPRSGNRGFILHNSTPKKWENLCEQVFKKCSNRTDDENIIFIKAWNEWGEGNYLEPDLKYGRSYLDALKKAFCNCDVFDLDNTHSHKI